MKVNENICGGFDVRQRMGKKCMSLGSALNAGDSTAAGRSSLYAPVLLPLWIFLVVSAFSRSEGLCGLEL